MTGRCSHGRIVGECELVCPESDEFAEKLLETLIAEQTAAYDRERTAIQATARRRL